MLFNYGKYKGVIISVALFLLLDASVLMINFYTSFQISKDAVAVNLAGRQRMLSQRAMKALLDMQLSQNDNIELERATNELSNVVKLFDATLNAFDQGGEVQGTGVGTEILEVVATPMARTAVDDTKALWMPFYDKLIAALSLSNGDSDYESLLNDAIAYGKTNNLQILSHMNDLTVEMEAVASSKATRLRIIQTVGILLAVINFFIIMVHFIRQLRESDEKIATAQRQTDEILETVDQGLFLLNQDLRISDKHSDEMKRIFGTADIAGKGFTDFIRGLISSKDLNNVERYFKLLFDPSKKQRLLGDLNPLKQVAIQVPDGKNNHIDKHLKFSFSRVDDEESVEKVLASVTDITQQVKLSKELEGMKNRNEQQLEMISVLLNGDPELIPMFIQSSSTAFAKINTLLEVTSHGDREYRKKADDVFSVIHNVKGEAGALSLDVIADLCHEFENKIKIIQQQPLIQGNDFLSLTVILDQLMSYDSLLDDMHSKIYSDKNVIPQAKLVKSNSWLDFRATAYDIAQRHGKKVEVTAAGLNDQNLNPEFIAKLNSITVQLIRNAVIHGVETPHERLAGNKSEFGLINLSLAERSNGDFRFTFSDDGKGIDRNKLIDAAIAQNRLNKFQAKELSMQQLAQLMFEPNISQQSKVDMDSGQGIGLYSVKTIVDELAGKISIRETPNRGITFIINIPAQVNQSIKAA